MSSLFSNLMSALSKPVRKMEPGKVYVMYLRNYHPDSDAICARGGLTVAMVLEPNGSIAASVAICSASENFTRKVGNSLARTRLANRDPRFTRVYTADEHFADMQSEMVMVEDIACRMAQDVPEVSKAYFTEVEIYETEYNLFPAY